MWQVNVTWGLKFKNIFDTVCSYSLPRISFGRRRGRDLGKDRRVKIVLRSEESDDASMMRVSLLSVLLLASSFHSGALGQQADFLSRQNVNSMAIPPPFGSNAPSAARLLLNPALRGSPSLARTSSHGPTEERRPQAMHNGVCISRPAENGPVKADHRTRYMVFRSRL
jgi:hypothetical protein